MSSKASSLIGMMSSVFVFSQMRCYEFLYIRFPFSWSFWEVPKHTLFASQKKRDLGFQRCGIPSYFSFPKQSFIAPHTIISEVYFNNREFILFFWCHSEFSVHFFCPLFLSTFFFCLLYWVSLHLFCLHFRYNVHHLNYLAYHFYCFRVNSKF